LIKIIMKIGFFDSGLGGLTILNAVRVALPEYDYVYFGDTKNLPYGDKEPDEILALSKYAVSRLFDRGASIVIVACNTASTQALRELQDTLLTGIYTDKKLLGVIVPTIEELIESDTQKALLIGTQRTIESQKYNRELEKVSSKIQLYTQAMPNLVPLIECGKIDEAFALLKMVLHSVVGEVDTLILGCTHYTVLKDRIRKEFGSVLTVISQDEIIPKKLVTYLLRHPEIESKLSRNNILDIELSGASDSHDSTTSLM